MTKAQRELDVYAPQCRKYLLDLYDAITDSSHALHPLLHSHRGLELPSTKLRWSPNVTRNRWRRSISYYLAAPEEAEREKFALLKRALAFNIMNGKLVLNIKPQSLDNKLIALIDAKAASGTAVRLKHADWEVKLQEWINTGPHEMFIFRADGVPFSLEEQRKVEAMLSGVEWLKDAEAVVDEDTLTIVV